MVTSKIIGTGGFLPQKILTNDDLANFLDTSNEWITTRTGIKERHICQKELGESCAQMAYEASKKALDAASITPKDLDLIIVATATPDFRLPMASSLLQEKLGKENIPAFDLNVACAGSVYGLNIAHSFIACGQYKNILFVGSEVMSSAIDWQDRNTAVLFGDGASAAVLTSSQDKNKGFLDFMLYADGRQKDTIVWDPTNSKIVMNGRETYKFAVRSLCEAAEKMLSKNNITSEKISYIVPHQANLRIIEAIAERIGVPIEKFLINLDKCANTSSASLLLALDEAIRDKKLKEGDLIFMMAIGAGFAWGTALYRV